MSGAYVGLRPPQCERILLVQRSFSPAQVAVEPDLRRTMHPSSLKFWYGGVGVSDEWHGDRAEDGCCKNCSNHDYFLSRWAGVVHGRYGSAILICRGDFIKREIPTDGRDIDSQ